MPRCENRWFKGDTGNTLYSFVSRDLDLVDRRGRESRWSANFVILKIEGNRPFLQLILCT